MCARVLHFYSSRNILIRNNHINYVHVLWFWKYEVWHLDNGVLYVADYVVFVVCTSDEILLIFTFIFNFRLACASKCEWMSWTCKRQNEWANRENDVACLVYHPRERERERDLSLRTEILKNESIPKIKYRWVFL